MKKQDMFKLVAVMALTMGSVAMAGDAVDVTQGASSNRVTLSDDANSGPSGIEVGVREGYVTPRPTVMRQKSGQQFRELRIKPAPQADRVPTCSENPLRDLAASFFGFADVNARCLSPN